MNLPTANAAASIAEKIELGFAHYLHHSCRRFGFAFLTTTRGGPATEFPILHLSVDNLENHPDLPPEEGTYQASLTLTLYADSGPDACRPDLLDDHLEAIECAMYAVSDAQSFLNLQSSGVDSRPIDQFHLYDIAPASLDLDTSDTTWIETRSYEITAVGVDTQFAAAAVVPTTAAYLTLGANYITLGGNKLTLAS